MPALMDPTTGRETTFSSSTSSPADARSGSECSRISDVDQAANEFIRKIRQDLKIQRLNSLAATAASVDEFKLKSLERSGRFLRKPSFEIDIDKSADEFINRFRQNLKIERQESLENYMEMLNRGV